MTSERGERASCGEKQGGKSFQVEVTASAKAPRWLYLDRGGLRRGERGDVRAEARGTGKEANVTSWQE